MSCQKRCLEIKQKIDGSREIFECDLIRISPQPAILRYTIKKHYHIDRIILEPNMITYGFYWENQEYTLYKWFDRDNKIIADYFNVADSVSITPETIVWRDLVLDLIVYPNGYFKWLDLDELKNIKDHKIKKKIDAAHQILFSKYWRLIQLTNRFVQSI